MTSFDVSAAPPLAAPPPPEPVHALSARADDGDGRNDGGATCCGDSGHPDLL